MTTYIEPVNIIKDFEDRQIFQKLFTSARVVIQHVESIEPGTMFTANSIADVVVDDPDWPAGGRWTANKSVYSVLESLHQKGYLLRYGNGVKGSPYTFERAVKNIEVPDLKRDNVTPPPALPHSLEHELRLMQQDIVWIKAALASLCGSLGIQEKA